jgi:hypothetical protein
MQASIARLSNQRCCIRSELPAAGQLSRSQSSRSGAASPADGKSVRLTSVFDAEQLKTRMTVVEVLQVMNDESYPPSVRFEAAKAALPFCHQPKDEISSDAAAA